MEQYKNIQIDIKNTDGCQELDDIGRICGKQNVADSNDGYCSF